MKLTIDTELNQITIVNNGISKSIDLYSDEAFHEISDQWLKIGWNQKYTYTFSWFGRPIIQLPEDMVRIQEVIYSIKPDVIIETGVAHGGSLVFYAGIMKAMGKGRVIGVDVEIRPHNRSAIEDHFLYDMIALVEGSSTETETIKFVSSLIKADESVMVILDSNHSKSHVLDELEKYSVFVTKGSYLVVTDGIMRDLSDVPRGNLNWKEDNPASAAIDFAKNHPEFKIEQPTWPFNESSLKRNVTHWPDAYLRRI